MQLCCVKKNLHLNICHLQLQNALMSFAELAESLPDELREVAKFGHPLEPVDETGRTLAVKEFAQVLTRTYGLKIR